MTDMELFDRQLSTLIDAGWGVLRSSCADESTTKVRLCTDFVDITADVSGFPYNSVLIEDATGDATRVYCALRQLFTTLGVDTLDR